MDEEAAIHAPQVVGTPVRRWARRLLISLAVLTLVAAIGVGLLIYMVVRVDAEHDVGVSIMAGPSLEVLYIAGTTGCFVFDGVQWIGELPRDLGGQR